MKANHRHSLPQLQRGSFPLVSSVIHNVQWVRCEYNVAVNAYKYAYRGEPIRARACIYAYCVKRVKTGQPVLKQAGPF